MDRFPSLRGDPCTLRSPDRHIVTKKPWWKRHARLFGKLRDRRSPHFRDAVLQGRPHVDAVGADPQRRDPLKAPGDDGSSADGVDEVSVRFHDDGSVQIILGHVNPDVVDDGQRRPGDTQGMSNGSDFKSECGQRLRQTRIALDYPVLRHFAENTGVTEGNLHNWEMGVSLVPPRYVQKLRELFGISHDWIYGGDATGLKYEIAIKLLGAGPSQET